MSIQLVVKRKSTATVACQFTGDNAQEIVDYMGFDGEPVIDDKGNLRLSVRFINYTIAVGTWIVRETPSTYELYKPDCFKLTYEIIDDSRLQQEIQDE